MTKEQALELWLAILDYGECERCEYSDGTQLQKIIDLYVEFFNMKPEQYISPNAHPRRKKIYSDDPWTISLL